MLVGAVTGVEHGGLDAQLGEPLGGLPGAPEAWCRITSASTPIAATVSTVSRSDSPLETDEPLAPMLITSADSHLPASSRRTGSGSSPRRTG